MPETKTTTTTSAAQLGELYYRVRGAAIEWRADVAAIRAGRARFAIEIPEDVTRLLGPAHKRREGAYVKSVADVRAGIGLLRDAVAAAEAAA